MPIQEPQPLGGAVPGGFGGTSLQPYGVLGSRRAADVRNYADQVNRLSQVRGGQAVQVAPPAPGVQLKPVRLAAAIIEAEDIVALEADAQLTAELEQGLIDFPRGFLLAYEIDDDLGQGPPDEFGDYPPGFFAAERTLFVQPWFNHQMRHFLIITDEDREQIFDKDDPFQPVHLAMRMFGQWYLMTAFGSLLTEAPSIGQLCQVFEEEPPP